ncbi:MAG: hypothetical protein A2293_07820 [Elusimicrobia bacterium RIFOXYB2_FULL_49_7]|nr:MAG: hypothetical protein A2293_07820 [Elusimicrobia bacterium RIFOXYB2_FULL_49_7]
MNSILFDCRHLERFKEGISRYTINLIDTVRNQYKVYLLFNNAKYILPKELDWASINRVHMPPPISSLAIFHENSYLLYILHKLKPDIYHAPCNTGLPIFKVGHTKYMVTLHDLIIEYFPESYRPLSRLKWKIQLPYNIRNADHIITVSNFSRQLLINRYKIPPTKISAIHHFLPSSFLDPQKESKDALYQLKARFSIDTQYFIYHGGFRSYKNVSRVIDIFNQIRMRSQTRYQLCLMGPQNTDFEINVRPFIKNSIFNKDIVVTGFLSDHELQLLLSDAICHIYAAKMEGFGFAPLEAMAAGIPVACPMSSSLPELLGDAAIWYNAQTDSGEVAELIMSSCLINKRRNEYIRKGREKIKTFNKETFLAKSINAYNTVLHNTHNKVE